MLTITEELKEKFWSNVLIDDRCWLWNAGRAKSGYGLFNYKKKTESCHRLSYALWYNKTVEYLDCIMHKCDNRLCVRPDHLQEGTIGDNNRDMYNKGRGGQEKYTFLSIEDLQKIQKMYSSKQYTQAELAKIFLVDQSYISRIVNKDSRFRRALCQ